MKIHEMVTLQSIEFSKESGTVLLESLFPLPRPCFRMMENRGVSARVDKRLKVWDDGVKLMIFDIRW